MFQHYIAIIFGKDGLYRTMPDKGTIKGDAAKNLKSFVIQGHRYKWDSTHVSRLCGWYPWQMPTFNPFKFLWQWLERRFISVGIILYREPEQTHPTAPVIFTKKDGKQVSFKKKVEPAPIPPMTFDNLVVKGYDRVTPALFRGAIKSPLYKRYQKKTSFGGGVKSQTVTIIVVGVIIVIVLLYWIGVIGNRAGG